MAEHADERRRLEELTASILDGRPIDWDEAETSTSHRLRGLVRQLRLVSAVAEAHRGVRSSVSPDSIGAGLPAPLPVPSEWGPLDVLEHIGRGSFGDVYRAWDRQLDRDVALKLLYEDDSDNQAPGPNASSIISEARLLARVHHPNVVTVYGADRLGGRVGLWMERVRGNTLEQLLRERGPFGPQEALLVGVDLCRALSAVHQAGIVHRDIKAHNVMRQEGGRIVLMDFGTGREPSGDDGEATLSGTPLYLAPEQFEGEQATRQSDIYSVGVLLFHLVSRAYPVEGSSVREVRAAHREGRRVWLRDLRPDLSEQFIKAIEPALAVDPAARYQSAGSMEQALLAAVAGLDGLAPGHAHSRSGEAVVPALEHDGSTRRPMWTAVAALSTAAVVGGLTLGDQVISLFRPPASPLSSAPQAGFGDGGELSARRVTLPDSMIVGPPSPDGRYLTYVDLNQDLSLFDLVTGQSRLVTDKGQSLEGAGTALAMSATGQIAYTWYALDGAHEIRLVGEDGAWPRVLFRRDDVLYPNPLQFSADGEQLLAMLELSGGRQQLVLIATATGAVRTLKTFDGGRYHPALSPDGRFVAFDHPQEDDPRARDIFVLNVEGDARPPAPIVAHPASDLFPLWSPDGRLVFASDRAGSLGLWAVGTAEGSALGDPQPLVRDLGRLARPLGLTDDGALYYQLQNGMVDVYTQSIDLSGQTPPGAPTPAAPTLVGTNISSDWSPDGRYLAYVSMRGWVQNDRYSRTLVVRDMETGVLRDLQPALTFFIQPRWSPDARTILVTGTDLAGRGGFFAVDVESGRTRAALLAQEGTIPSSVFQWSPDGRAIWFAKSGAIVAHDLANGREHAVVEYASHSIRRLQQWPGFRVSPDGGSVAYTGFTFDNNTGGTVVRVQILGGASWELARAIFPEFVGLQDWTPDGAGVLLIKGNSREQGEMLYEAPIDGSPMRPLGVAMDRMRDVSLRRDGRTITYTAGAGSLEVWVMKNFLTSAAGGAGVVR